MQTLKIVVDNKSPIPIDTAPIDTTMDTPMDTEAGGTADKMACMLTYLKSLEQAAEQVHGDNEDWRYGRYLFNTAMIAVLKKEAVQ